ncbi:hypothetical protein N431DRAFT_222563 [Stipitochalara longipes BDJ]|nr:hypothetical protein N431DRAFT_222563 [Stipitochalara longipes BDJ]
MVTFLIGPEGSDEKFSVHKEFVCHHSPVLKAAFNSNFMEGESQTYRLEEVSASAFRLLVQWFYNEEFDIFKEDDLDCENNEDDPEIEKLWVEQDLSLIQLWIVADKLLIRPLQNAVINVLEEFWEEPFIRHGGPSTAWIPYAYEHTTVGSPLRNFAADICAYKISPEGFASHPEDFPKEVLLDMAMVLSKAVSIWRHDDVTNIDDEEEPHSDDYISDSEEDEEDEGEGAAASTAATPGADGNNSNSAAEADNENEFDHGAEEDIWVDDGYEYFIGDVPELPRYQCHRSWRSYHVPEDEEE